MNPTEPKTKLKCFTVMVFEENGKTVLQPIIRDSTVESIHELFQKNTLEVWLPNGQSELDQFDIGILKYKQVAQPSKKCSKIKNRICLKNHFETIVTCETCSLSNEAPLAQKNQEHPSFPNLSLQLRKLDRCST